MKNRFSLQILPTKDDTIFDVYLIGDHKPKFLGLYKPADQGTFEAPRKAHHIFEKTNSFGLNYFLLHECQLRFKWIVIKFNNKNLITTREFFKSHSQVLHFKDFETQCFLPIELFGRKTAIDWENKITAPETEFEPDIFCEADYELF